MNEDEVLRMYEQIKRPIAPFTTVGTYTIPYNGSEFRFSTLVSADDIIAWTSEDENGRVNLHYGDSQCRVPVTIGNVSDLDISKMLAAAVSSKTKKSEPLDKIIIKYGRVFNQMQVDFNTYTTTMH